MTRVSLRGMQLGIPTLRSGAAPWTPASLPNLFLWWDVSDIATLYQDSAGTTPANADADPVGRINDKSGNNRNAVASATNTRPTLSTSLVAVTGDGSNDCLFATFTSVTLTAQTTFVVFTPTSTVSDERIFSQGLVSAGDEILTPGAYVPIMRFVANALFCSFIQGGRRAAVADPSGRLIFMSHHSGSTLTNKINNGVGSTYSSVLSTTVDTMGIMARAVSPLQYSPARFHEVLTYNRALTSDEQTLVYNYLNAKWTAMLP